MLILQLQRFAASSSEKTEKATPRKREESRKEGDVAKSPELTSALVLVSIIVVLRLAGPLVWNSWEGLITTDFTATDPANWTETAVMQLLLRQTIIAVKALVPIVFTGLVIGAGAAAVQVRPMFVPKLLAPKFSRVQPLAGLKRLFGTRSLVELAKSLLKLTIVGATGYSVVMQMALQIRSFAQMDITEMPGTVGNMVFQLGIRIAGMMVVLAFFDYLYQRFEFEKNLRMTKQEVKDEMKQMEGNAEVKGVIRRRARQLAMRRMMEEVPKADVVLTNPTHYAIAIRYDSALMSAPTVVAKGADSMAQRIKERAALANVPLVENRPLAQTLYRTVEIGEFVPAELYQAVAEVLAYVYRLQQLVRR